MKTITKWIVSALILGTSVGVFMSVKYVTSSKQTLKMQSVGLLQAQSVSQNIVPHISPKGTRQFPSGMPLGAVSSSLSIGSSPEKPTFTHIKTPEHVKAIYMTSWVSGLPKWRGKLIDLINKTELNAVVIDVKDYSGKISFQTGDPQLDTPDFLEIRVKDLPKLIQTLHENGIYVIARVTVFQDPTFSKLNPSQSVQTHSGMLWKDRHGLSYVDPSSQIFWKHILRIAKASEKIGFDEINFDYIRFPTDGNMQDMVFPISGVLQSETRPSQNAQVYSGKAKALEKFFNYLSAEMKTVGIPISADLFGMVLTNRDDLNIGQVLELAAPHFNYICPMIYPSHYPKNFNGYSNPADHPYDLIKLVLLSGSARIEALKMSRSKLRPWLQDFNLGAHYDASKIRAQIKGASDAGILSWLMWDPRNKYTSDGYILSHPTLKKEVTFDEKSSQKGNQLYSPFP